MRRTASGIILTLLSISMLTMTVNFRAAEADPGTIYIRADGSIDPPTANIITYDSVTYTLTGNIADSIVVQRSNIVIDGAGYTVQGAGSGTGFYWSGISNVILKNTNIKNFAYGIDLRSSSQHNTISGNNITNNQYGILLMSSPRYNSISGNNLTNNGYGVAFQGCSNNTASGNTIAGSWIGAYFDSSHNNTVSGNEFIGDGLVVYDSHGNVVVDNTVNNKPLVYLENASDQAVTDAGQVILVHCDHIQVQNLNLSYTTIGVELWNTNSTLISDNNLTRDCEYGVLLTHSCSYNTISGNNITLGNMSINQAGILLEYSCNYNTISENNITASIGVGSGVGLVNSCGQNSISGNVFVGVGLFVDRPDVNTVTSNTVNGKPLVCLKDASDQAVTDAGQVILVNCTRIQIQNLNLSYATTGVGLFMTNHTLISGNTMTDEAYGIALTYSFNNTISENTVTNNAYGITLNAFSNYNDVSRNNVNDTISSPYIGTSPHGGILLISSCNYNGIRGNMIADRRYGIILSSSCSYNGVSGNSVTNSTYGIMLQASCNFNGISGNRIKKSSYGIGLSTCNNNTISGNTASNSTYGIYLSMSSNNTIHHNNFIDNTNHVGLYGASTNVWDNGYPSGGNYWSGYTDVDLYSGPNQDQPGSDNIWDHPRVIDSNNKDRYPLVNKWIVADVNYDRIVDIIDAAAISAHWYPGPPVGPLGYDPNFDITSDGSINVLDAALVSAYWTGPPKGPLAP